MYETIDYNGQYHSFKLMWLYTRTLVENPSIGLLVQHATFRNCYMNAWHERLREDAPSDRIERRERRAICSLGCLIGFRVADLSRALQSAKRFPLMPIIISKLPNLITLSLELKESDEYHHELDKVLAVPGSFPRLRDVVLTLRPFFNGQDVLEISSRSRRCYTPRVIFSKESVRKLVINDAHFHKWQGVDAFEEQNVSNVTDLSINPSFKSEDVYLYLPRILQMPRTLVSLTLTLKCPYEEGDEIPHDSHLRMPTCQEVWKWLDGHKASLKHLNFHLLTIPMSDITINPRIQRGSQMGSLTGFQQLQSLSIQPQALLGHSTSGEEMQEQLKEKLPNSLVSLYLYADENLALDASLERQMLDVVTSSSFATLKSLRLEDCKVILWDMTALPGEMGAGDIVDYRDSSLPSICADSGICFTVEKDRAPLNHDEDDERSGVMLLVPR